MPSPIIQCAANFSEGRRPDVIEAIVSAAGAEPGAVVADWSADVDHNRMVLTLLGDPEPLRRATLAAARVAVERIDLREHTGAHPRIGAVDVVPFVPVRAATLADCVALSREVAHDLATQLNLPVYLYERSAATGRRASLPEIRKGGFEGLTSEPLTGPRAPDFGPAEPHPTAGAAVVGARGPLVAYNIDLDSSDVSLARKIAATIREERAVVPEITGVRSLGIWLRSRGRAQVSMNVTRPTLTPLPAVFDFVRREAHRHGVGVWESEIIGLIPRASLGGETPERILWRGYRETQVLEYWLNRL